MAASIPVVSSPADNASGSAPLTVSGTETVNTNVPIVELRDDSGLLYPAQSGSTNPVLATGGNWSTVLSALDKGTRGGVYSVFGGTVSLPAGAQVASAMNGTNYTQQITTAAGPPLFLTIPAYNLGDLIVVCIGHLYSNEWTAPTVQAVDGSNAIPSGASAFVKKNALSWTGASSLMNTYVTIFTWIADGSSATATQVRITYSGTHSLFAGAYKVTGQNGTIKPASLPGNDTPGLYGSSSGNVTPQSTPAQVDLTQAKGNRPSAGSIIIGITGGYKDLGGGATPTRSALDANTTLDAQLNTGVPFGTAFFFWRSTSQSSGSADVSLGTSGGTLVHNSICIEID
jgi:hypothetical protein